MLSRDFVQAFILGQVRGGIAPTQARTNFADWLKDQADAIATDREKEMIIADLSSYGPA